MITFQNDGLLDLRAIRTFGISVKETPNPIGFFGTGLKYAIAILCRLGYPPAIYIGTDRVVIDIQPVNMRGKDFSLITMDGDELGFTTELGKTWKAWQAFRELYCNAMDEPGGVIVDGELAPEAGKTTITVYAPEFDEVWRTRHEFILQGRPDWTADGVEIIDRPSRHLFYKGIRVGDLKQPAELTYNVVGHSLDLTEDRTVAWYWGPQRMVAKALLTQGTSDLLRRVLSAPMESYESELDFNEYSDAPGPHFMALMEHMPFREVTNSTAIRAWRKASGRLYEPDTTPMDAVEVEQLRRSIEFLEALGYPVSLDPVIVTADLAETMLGCVWEGKIFLSRRCFNMGTKQVAMTLLEEHLHHRRGFVDMTRELQNYLFELVVTYGERFKGVPL